VAKRNFEKQTGAIGVKQVRKCGDTEVPSDSFLALTPAAIDGDGWASFHHLLFMKGTLMSTKTRYDIFSRFIKRPGGWAAVCAATSIWGLGVDSARAATTVAASPANNLIDTTDYSVLGAGTGYWFANFGNPSAVTAAPMNSFEANNIPSWIHLDANPAHLGKADDGTTADSTEYTGFSFGDDSPASNSTGGQPGWNTLTLPDGTTGLSGAAVDVSNASSNTDNYVFMRILSGAPSTATMWVVTDNWGSSATNADPLSRLRVRTKLLDGGFNDIGDISQVDSVPGSPLPNNGIADAYAFKLTGITPGDGLVIRISSAATGHGSIAGVMFTPEPSSIALLTVGLIGFGMRRRRQG
jgi:hypothetical protein